MKKNKQQLNVYCKYLLENDAKDDVIESISTGLFDRFRRSSKDERVVISNIMDSLELFFNEVRAIVDSNSDPKIDIIEDINRD